VTNYTTAKCSPKTSESPGRGLLPNVEPEALVTGSRRRHVVGCLYVGLCVVHGGPLLFTVFFSIVCTVVHDDIRLATTTLDSIKVIDELGVSTQWRIQLWADRAAAPPPLTKT